MLNNPTEEILTLCAVGITACKYLGKGQHEDITLTSSVIAAYLLMLHTLVRVLVARLVRIRLVVGESGRLGSMSSSSFWTWSFSLM